VAQLFVPLSGSFAKIAGSGFNTYGEDLERPYWRGAELGALDTFPDVWGAVGEAEYHDWIIGVHHPLYKKGGADWCRFFDQDPVVRARALALAHTGAQAAHQIGARYILFHFPWPGFLAPGANYTAADWHFTDELTSVHDWPEDKVYDVSRRAFERLAEIQAKESIQIVLEIAGPNPYFFDGDLYSRLFTQFPELSLCQDTGRLGLLAKTHGQDPIALCKRWLPWTRYLHLSTSMWDDAGTFHNHIPTNGSHTVAKWPLITPAADMAHLVIQAQPDCSIVLQHNPKAVLPEALAEAHAWAEALVGEG
jgi:hypothetical protein